jgi:hypothetical protein
MWLNPFLTGCTPTPTPITPYDASDGGGPPGCEVDERISAQRLIRTDSGASLVLPPCPDSGGTTVIVTTPDGSVVGARR